MERTVFQQTVAAAVAQKAGIPLAKAIVLVERSKVGALKVADIKYLFYKGPDYWAEKVVEYG